ncbi:MAG: anti-sigma F factor [Lachnospiraceae bacterium]|nr:anti-sigma F factor [Lachnospiraceae bacterium]
MDKEKQTGVQETVRVEFQSYSHNEQFARVVTAVFMARLNPTMEELEDVKTAVSEAVTNCVIHAYEDCIGTIRMELETTGRELTVRVQDWGIGIENLDQAREPLYTSKPSRDRSGMGFTFMETFMDGMEVSSSAGEGTTVVMRKLIGSSILEKKVV